MEQEEKSKPRHHYFKHGTPDGKEIPAVPYTVRWNLPKRTFWASIDISIFIYQVILTL